MPWRNCRSCAAACAVRWWCGPGAGRVRKADVALLASRRAVCDAAAVDALATVARRHGGLRDVAHVLDHASIFARGGVIETGHVLAAIEDLKLGPKGGK